MYLECRVSNISCREPRLTCPSFGGIQDNEFIMSVSQLAELRGAPISPPPSFSYPVLSFDLQTWSAPSTVLMFSERCCTMEHPLFSLTLSPHQTPKSLRVFRLVLWALTQSLWVRAHELQSLLEKFFYPQSPVCLLYECIPILLSGITQINLFWSFSRALCMLEQFPWYLPWSKFNLHRLQRFFF